MRNVISAYISTTYNHELHDTMPKMGTLKKLSVFAFPQFHYVTQLMPIGYVNTALKTAYLPAPKLSMSKTTLTIVKTSLNQSCCVLYGF